MNSQKTIEGLKAKAKDSSKRMPSLAAIHQLLDEKGIVHSFSGSQNIVESRSGRNTYVNDRHEGKIGKEIIIKSPYLKLDTSDSYYSWNSFRYAIDLLKIIGE